MMESELNINFKKFLYIDTERTNENPLIPQYKFLALWKPGTWDVFTLRHSNVILAPFCCICPLLSGSQRLLASCALVYIFCPCTDTCNLLYAVLSSCNKATKHYAGHTGISQHEVLKAYSSDTKDILVSPLVSPLSF
jgi:hypothetical protein